MQEISQKARQVLEYLTQRESSIPPTVREIGAALQIKSTSTVHKYLTELATAGYIEKGDKMNRAISLPQQQSAKVPLLGVVTAGQPILAVEDIEGYVPYQGGRYPANELFGAAGPRRVHDRGGDPQWGYYYRAPHARGPERGDRGGAGGG